MDVHTASTATPTAGRTTEPVSSAEYNHDHFHPKYFAVHWRHYEEHDAAEAFIRQVRSLNVYDTLSVRDDLPRLRLAARIVWGEADQFQKVRFGEFVAKDLKTEMRRIPGGKHFTPEDHPIEVARAINDLVREIRERGT